MSSQSKGPRQALKSHLPECVISRGWGVGRVEAGLQQWVILTACKGDYLISHWHLAGVGGRGQHWAANREGREPGPVQLTRLWHTGQ